MLFGAPPSLTIVAQAYCDVTDVKASVEYTKQIQYGEFERVMK